MKKQEGYIYKLISNNIEKIYIGSTFQNLNKRFSDHKQAYKCYQEGKYRGNMTAFEILKFDDAKIILINTYSNITKKELLDIETDEIKKNISYCVNKQLPSRSHKQWLIDNADKMKEYNLENKEHHNKVVRDYHQKNKDKIHQRKNEKINCNLCCKIFSRANKAYHFKKYHSF